jgi:hypothetical protein
MKEAIVNSSMVSIDLGSSFTKIGVRDGWNGTSRLVSSGELSDAGNGYCIPSVVARVKRGTSIHWQIGLAAAQQIRGDGTEVFEDWKAGLFVSQPSTQSEEIALRFFLELKTALGKINTCGIDFSMPTRLCIPKLETSAQAGERLVSICSEAGWRMCRDRGFVFEPESNVWGLSTWGRNQTGPSRGFEGGNLAIRLQAMLERSPLQEAYRDVKEGGFGVCVMDIGAFTTDFAYLRFDTGHETADWTKPKVKQHSVSFGVRDLSRMIIENLNSEVVDLLSSLSTNERDERMRRLYHGQPSKLVRASGGSLVLGTPAHLEIVERETKRFATRIWAERSEFRSSHIDEGPHPEYITGGGSMIPQLAKALEQKKSSEARRYYPQRTCRSTDELLRLGEPANQAQAELHRRKGQELRRGASAIGGTSVFFEFGNQKRRRLIHNKYGARYE